MSTQLVLLALEAGPLFGVASGSRGVHTADGPALMIAMIERYLAAGRQDADQAEADERSARTRLFVAEQQRVEASRTGIAAKIQRTEAALETERSKMLDAARRLTEARSDCAFAEGRLAKSHGVTWRRPQLSGQALRTFAVERLRQLEEVAGMRRTERPSRDKVLVADLRSRFESLSLAS